MIHHGKDHLEDWDKEWLWGSSKSKSTSASSLKEANTNKHDKSIYGGITMSRFELSWIIHDWWYR